MRHIDREKMRARRERKRDGRERGGRVALAVTYPVTEMSWNCPRE